MVIKMVMTFDFRDVIYGLDWVEARRIGDEYLKI
jgi:hypothetical protein